MTANRSRGARLLDRIFDRRPVVRRAVLRDEDMRRNVMPVVCVKTGAPTDRVVHRTAIETEHLDGWVIAIGVAATVAVLRLRGRATAVASIPVGERAWTTWQSRLRVAVGVTSVGLGLLIAGMVRGITALVVVGSILLALGWLNRVRTWHNAWIGITYRADRREVVLSRVHSEFDAQAAAIYRRSVARRR